MVRQFKLINSIGEELDLNRLEHFLNAPSGLGFQKENAYSRVGASFFLTDDESAQKVATGEMVFKNYEGYFNFYKFISKEPLKLLYKPNDTWAYLDCTVTRLDKGEISLDGFLHCPIDFTATSKWYIPRTPIVSETVDLSNTKTYDYHYGYVYVERVNGIFNIHNDSTIDCPVVITVRGFVLNPSWSLTVNGEQVVQNRIEATIPLGQRLVINARDGAREICMYDNKGLVANVYQMIDFNSKAFVVVPPGDSTIVITDDSGNAIDATVEVDELYETV